MTVASAINQSCSLGQRGRKLYGAPQSVKDKWHIFLFNLIFHQNAQQVLYSDVNGLGFITVFHRFKNFSSSKPFSPPPTYGLGRLDQFKCSVPGRQTRPHNTCVKPLPEDRFSENTFLRTGIYYPPGFILKEYGVRKTEAPRRFKVSGQEDPCAVSLN